MNERRAYISGGHVYCRERQRDEDIANCLECPLLADVNERTSPPYIVCELSRPAGGMFNEDPGFNSWWYRHHRRGR